MKFKVKSKDCQLIVKVKTSYGEIIDEKELDRFARMYLRGFLKPKQIKKKLIEYTGPIGISLYERLKKPITKRDFLFLVEQIVLAVQKLQDSNMSLNNMILDIHNVFVNEVTKEVQFLYVPMTKGQNNSNIIEFIESVVYSVKPYDEKDNDFASRFIYFFRGIKLFDINKVEMFIVKEDRSVVNTIKKQSAGQSGFMTDKPQHYYDHYRREQADPTGDETTGLLNEDDDDEATRLLSEDDYEEGTALLDEKIADVHYPTLSRVLTGETISINKPVFRIGKERSYVDYFVSNNIAVSRSHADIITRGNKYFVKDLNSKNHTYINNQELPVQYEVEIYDGDRLKLANEEFVFHV